MYMVYIVQLKGRQLAEWIKKFDLDMCYLELNFKFKIQRDWEQQKDEKTYQANINQERIWLALLCKTKFVTIFS